MLSRGESEFETSETANTMEFMVIVHLYSGGKTGTYQRGLLPKVTSSFFSVAWFTQVTFSKNASTIPSQVLTISYSLAFFHPVLQTPRALGWQDMASFRTRLLCENARPKIHNMSWLLYVKTADFFSTLILKNNKMVNLWSWDCPTKNLLSLDWKKKTHTISIPKQRSPKNMHPTFKLGGGANWTLEFGSCLFRLWLKKSVDFFDTKPPTFNNRSTDPWWPTVDLGWKTNDLVFSTSSTQWIFGCWQE